MVVGPSLIVSTSIPDAFSTATDIAVSIKKERNNCTNYKDINIKNIGKQAKLKDF